jgi:hypothetical protein
MKMPVSLGRKIRRIGIPPKEGRVEGWKANILDSHVAAEATQIISVAKHLRIKSRTLRQFPKQEHRRSKNRIKRITKTVEVSRGKK